MGQVLAYRLHGPTASWGTVEAGVERRPSTRDPGRGAVLGILAAALGFRRDETKRHAGLSDGVLIAVCGHGERRLVQDYRTVQTVEPLRNEDFRTRGQALARAQKVHTLTGWRQHVEDGLWRVFVASAGADLVELGQALERPVFELYLGRREHPFALPPDPQLIPGGLPEALDAYPPEPGIRREERDDHDLRGWIAQRICAAGNGDLWWDPGFPGACEGNGRIVVDQPVTRAGWRFRSREMRWRTAPPSALSASSFFDAAEGGQ
jgi:CRISPR system Cascade subunit CasD